MAVIAAIELEENVAARRAPRHADGAHRRLGARADEAHHLHRRIRGRDHLGQVHLARRGRAVAGAAGHRRRHRLHDGPRGVTEDQRPPRADEVEIAPAVDVGEARALRAGHEERLAPDPAECADGTVDAAGDHTARGLEQVRRIHQVRASSGLTSIGTKSLASGLQRNAPTAATRLSTTDTTTYVVSGYIGSSFINA